MNRPYHLDRISRFGSIAVFCAFAVICLSLYRAHHAKDVAQQVAFFSTSLHNTGIQNISTGTRVYVVTDGMVTYQGQELRGSDSVTPLRIAYEKVVAERSPLVALAAVDPVQMVTAIQQLQQTSVELAQQQHNPSNASLVLSSLYPIDFLNSFAQLESARLAFITSGSASDASAYEYAQAKAFVVFDQSIAHFRSAFKKAVPTNTPQYATEQSVTGPSDVLHAIDILSTGMAHTQRLFDVRLRCFRGYVDACDAGDVSIPQLIQPVDITSSTGEIKLAQTIRNALLTGAMKLASTSEPFYQLSSSACTKERTGTSLLYTFMILPSATGTAPHDTPYYVGDMRFVASAQYAKLPYYSYFAANHIPYVASSVITYYSCLESDTDLGRVTAMREVRKFALLTHLSTYATGNAANELRDLESRLGSSSVVTDADIISYLNTTHSLIGKPGVPQADAARILALTLSLKDNSMGVYQTILNITGFEHTNMVHNRNGITIDFSAPYLFFTRSAFAPLFLGSNSSATGPQKELFPSDELPESERPFIFYSNLRSTPGVEPELKKDIKFYSDLHLGM